MEERDILNRGLVLVDGDNVFNTFKIYRRYPYLDALREWIAETDNLGIDKVVGYIHFGSLHKDYGIKSLIVPYTPRDDVTVWLYPVVDGHGYPDSVIFREAWRKISEFETLVLVSSDHDFLKFADEIRAGYNRFTGRTDPHLAREVISVLSDQNAPFDWQTRTSNYVELEQILVLLQFAEDDFQLVS